MEEELPIPPLERDRIICMVSFESSSSPHHKKLISTKKSLELARRTGAAKKSVEHVIRQPGQLESIHPPSRAHLRVIRDIHRRRGASAFGMRNNVERRVRRAPHAAAARIVRSAPRPRERRRARVQLLRDVRPNPEFVSGTLRTRRIVRPDHAPAVLPATVDAIAVEVPVLSRFSIGTPAMSDLCGQVTPGRRRTRDGGVAVGE